MAKFMQIIDVDTNGSEVVLHPETNADFIVSGATYKVPKIIEITDWNARSKELIEARKGKTSLKLKIDEIDNALKPLSLLESIKTVDGSGSGLDADTVDGRTVDDANDSSTSLWTAEKVITELKKKVNNVDVVTVATANKLLRLDSNGLLPTSITKNSATTTKFINDLTFKFTGDVTGSVVFNGSEKTKTVSLQVENNSHTHDELTGIGPMNVNATGTGNIMDFKVNGLLKSSITKDGKFTGDAATVNGYKVNNLDKNSLWSGVKVESAIADGIKRDVPTIAKNEAQTIVESELQQYAVKTETGVALGPVNFITGEVALDDLETVNISISSVSGAKLLNESYVISSLDKTISFVKDPSSTIDNVKINLNKIAPAGSKLTWYAAIVML